MPRFWLTRALVDYLGLAGILLVLVAILSVLGNNFLTLRTFTTMANQVPALAIVTVGMTLVLVVGGIDLSVGSVMGLCGAVLGVALVQWNWPLWLAGPLALGVGLSCGLVSGAITQTWRLPSFIFTLGMLEVARGCAYLVTQSKTMYLGTALSVFSAPLPGVGLSLAFFLAVLVVALGQILLSATVLGRYALAIGNNELSVRYSGIDPRPIKVALFAASGLLAALAGLVHCARLSSSDPNAGVGLELSAIAAAVIGGTSLLGGRGSVINSFLGVLIIAVLETGLAQLGATEPAKRLVTGVVIVTAVIADLYRHRLASFQRANASIGE